MTDIKYEHIQERKQTTSDSIKADWHFII